MIDLSLEKGDIPSWFSNDEFLVFVGRILVVRFVQIVAVGRLALIQIDSHQMKYLRDTAGAVEHVQHVLHEIQRDGMATN